MVERLHFENRADWLKGRARGIGASEMAAIVGLHPWLSPSELWQLKTGRKEREDLSTNASVSLGVRSEDALRNLFMAKHYEEFDLGYYPFDMLYQPERPWQYATLDGELVRLSDCKKGILEIKTATPTGMKWKEWDGKVPEYYYIQILSQFLATGYDFAYLFAALFTMDGNIIVKEYEFAREDCEDDMKWLLERAIKFWQKIEKQEMPSAILRL